MPNPSTYPYRRFPTIQVGAADHAARGTDAVKQELHALCAGSSKTVVTVECYPGTDQAEILALFPHAELVIHADDLAILPAELDAKIEHELTDDPVFGIMTTSQVISGVLLPVLLVFLVLIINDRHTMGKYVNSRLWNVLTWGTIVLVGVLTVVMFAMQALGV